VRDGASLALLGLFLAAVIGLIRIAGAYAGVCVCVCVCE
jgi:hypothetical protein